jgi:bifunctional non-homologous end joining protein LigD
VPVYSVRPKQGAPVAVPLTWDELDTAEPNGWNVRTIADRLAQTPDPWPDFARRARSLDATKRWLARATLQEERHHTPPT